MAHTKRKRRTKHRGNAAGIVEVRGKTHKGGPAGPSKGSARDQARRRRQNRFDQPPTWRSAAIRAAVAALIFVVLVIAAFGRPIAEGVALGGFVLLFYIPLGYFTDLALYKRRQIQKRKQAADQ
ncbi:MAG TPA: hypothetical protein VLB47_01345 [Solirubrobacteraceae bacterium]|nr:hypothetical protein [Solirubrobacteraceae bacterium]